ncbi:MAG: D-alanyl-D-alanine carboxypeptidase family protein [Candidatus Omnitrophota bacterium]
MSKIVRIILIVFLGVSLATPAQAWFSHHRKHRKVAKATSYFTARSALLWNITSNQVYFSKDAQAKIYPASTTKVMTVMLALEKLPLDGYVTVSARATDVAPTKLDFRPGEQYLVRDLVYACLLKSANDAAGVLAEAVGGTQEKFVDMMNQKALELGARNTHFANPHGLPSQGKQYTTAMDMAIILREALKNPFFQSATTFRYRIIYSKDGRRHFLKSHNKALFLDWKQDVLGKTGYTKQAQSCFVGYLKRGNEILIVDVFGCRNRTRWDDLKWMVEHYAKVNL